MAAQLAALLLLGLVDAAAGDALSTALAADSECPVGSGSSCALNALQLRKAQATPEKGKAEEVLLEESAGSYPGGYFSGSAGASGFYPGSSGDYPGSGQPGGYYPGSGSLSESACCVCKDGAVSWSKTGKCRGCKRSGSGTDKTFAAAPNCQFSRGQAPPGFAGPKGCSRSCRSFHSSATGGHHPNSGLSSPTCNTMTHGTCNFVGCDASRGPVDCVSGQCVCKPGYCSADRHKCTETPCSKQTEGTCALFGCAASRGPTDCVQGLCVCKTGYCSSDKQTCSAMR